MWQEPGGRLREGLWASETSYIWKKPPCRAAGGVGLGIAVQKEVFAGVGGPAPSGAFVERQRPGGGGSGGKEEGVKTEDQKRPLKEEGKKTY